MYFLNILDELLSHNIPIIVMGMPLDAFPSYQDGASIDIQELIYQIFEESLKKKNISASPLDLDDNLDSSRVLSIDVKKFNEIRKSRELEWGSVEVTFDEGENLKNFCDIEIKKKMELREKRNVPQQDREFSVSSVPDTDISFGLEASVVFVIEDIDQVNFNSLWHY